MTTTTIEGFAAALAVGPDWGTVAKGCLDRLGPVAGANLGFLYLTDSLAEDAGSIVTLLRGVTGIRDWVGTVGFGVCGMGEELFDQTAMAVMVGRFPPDSVRLFTHVTTDLARFEHEHGAWVRARAPVFGLVHGDPRNPRLGGLVERLAAATGAFLVGALTASRGASHPQFGGGHADGPVHEGGVSGVLFGPEVPVVTGLTQGCAPIGPVRTITAAGRNVIHTIDDRPALEVFKQDIGELLARDLRRTAGYIFAALPIAASDTGDYRVRNIVAIDPQRGRLAIAEPVVPGQRILFTRRDRGAAQADLERMLTDLKRRLDRSPRGGVYVSCVARGPNLFGEGSHELKTIRGALGDVPLVGVFANGEISNGRLYGYTGVLTLFL